MHSSGLFLCTFFRIFTLSLFFVHVALSSLSKSHFLVTLSSCGTLLMFYFFHVALFSCCTHVALFFLHSFELSCVNFFRAGFLYKYLEGLPVFHVLHKSWNLEILQTDFKWRIVLIFKRDSPISSVTLLYYLKNTLYSKNTDEPLDECRLVQTNTDESQTNVNKCRRV